MRRRITCNRDAEEKEAGAPSASGLLTLTHRECRAVKKEQRKTFSLKVTLAHKVRAHELHLSLPPPTSSLSLSLSIALSHLQHELELLRSLASRFLETSHLRSSKLSNQSQAGTVSECVYSLLFALSPCGYSVAAAATATSSRRFFYHYSTCTCLSCVVLIHLLSLHLLSFLLLHIQRIRIFKRVKTLEQLQQLSPHWSPLLSFTHSVYLHVTLCFSFPSAPCD